MNAKRILSLLLALVMVFTMLPTSVFAETTDDTQQGEPQPENANATLGETNNSTEEGSNSEGNVTYVAQIGAEKYATLREALLAADSVATIEILDGTWGADAIGERVNGEWDGSSTNPGIRYKSLTIQPAEGATVTFTSDVYIGYDDSRVANANVTVQNINFQNAALTLAGYRNVTVENCRFDGTYNSDNSGTLIILDSCATGHLTEGAYPASQVTVENCTINGSPSGNPGIRLRNTGNVTLQGNIIKNTSHNGILIESDNKTIDNTSAKTVSVQGNTITEWNSGNVSDGGRAMRLSLGSMASDSTVTITGNRFTKEQINLDSPDFVKLSGASSATANISGNYWNNQTLETVKEDNTYYTSDASTTTIESVIREVAQIGSVKYATLANAIADVPANGTKTTIQMIADETINVATSALTVAAGKNVVLDLNGQTITGYCDSGKPSALITNKGTLTIKDTAGEGKLRSGATPTWIYDGSGNFAGSYASNTITNNGNLTVEGGYIENMSTGSAAYAIDNNSTIYDTELNMKGGTLTSARTVVRMFCNSITNKNTVNISGGEIVTTAGSTAIWTQLPGSSGQAKKGELHISGGSISAATNAWYDYSFGDVYNAITYTITGGRFNGVIKSEEKTGFVTGGIYSQKPAEDYIADGYAVLENTDTATKDAYPWKVAVKPTATVTTTTDGGITATIDAGFITNNEVTFAPDSGSKVSVTFDEEAATAIATNADNSALKLKVEDTTEPGATSNTKTYEITMVKVVNEVETPVFSGDNAAGKATVTVPFEAVNDTYPVVVNLVDGSDRTPVPCTYDKDEQLVTFTVEHFSDYEVSQQDDAVVELSTTGGNKYYTTLEAAFAAAVDGDTIKLLANCEGNGIVVPQGKFPNGLTVDFDGHTYTITGPSLAGSTGTKTQAFQLLKGNTITFKNGAIVGDNADVKMLIQNYSNLTLDKMVLNATQGNNNVGYVLSTNNGSTTIKDTTITAKAGGTAFDACSGWGGYASNTVEVTGTSVINGDVEVSYYGQTGTAPATLTLTSGTLNGNIVMANGTDQVTVTKADTFTAAAPADYEWVDNGNGTKKLAPKTYVAQIGGTKYESLAEAFAAVQNNETIVLLANAALSSAVVISDGDSITLDLNGFTTSGGYVDLYNGFLTVTDSAEGEKGAFGNLVCVNVGADEAAAEGAYNNFTLADGTTMNNNVYVYQNDTAKGYGSKVVIRGTMNGLIFVLGNIHEGNTVVDVYGRINSTSDVGIALNGFATVNVYEGARIEAQDANGKGTGIEVRAGNLNVKGGTIIGHGAPTEVNPNGSGTTSTGAGIAVAQHTTMLPIDVKISGGTISGYSAFYESNPQNNAATDIAKIKLSISGGSFTATQGGTQSIVAFDTATIGGFVSGGEFSNEVPAAYCAQNYEPVTTTNASGMYEVEVEEAFEPQNSTYSGQDGYKTNFVDYTFANVQDSIYMNVVLYINTGYESVDKVTNGSVHFTFMGINQTVALSAFHTDENLDTASALALATDGYYCYRTGNVYIVRIKVFPYQISQKITVQLLNGGNAANLYQNTGSTSLFTSSTDELKAMWTSITSGLKTLKDNTFSTSLKTYCENYGDGRFAAVLNSMLVYCTNAESQWNLDGTQK